MEIKDSSTVHSLEIGGDLCLNYFEYTVGIEYPLNDRATYKLLYCDRGNLTLASVSGSHSVSRGQAYIVSPDTKYKICIEDLEGAASVDISFLSNCPKLKEISERVIEFDNLSVNLLFSAIREAGINTVVASPSIISPSELFASDQVIRNYIELLLIHLIRSPYETEAFAEPLKVGRSGLLVRRISEYMKEHMSEKITFSDITTKFSVSPTTLKKLFKKHYDCGTMEHLTSIRINTAKELLREGKYSCTEIASLCGFCSIHHFSKVFKEKCDMTPTEYMRSAKSMLEHPKA